MKLIGTIELETPRLLLRKFAIDDAFNMYNNWASDDEVTKYLLWKTHESIEVTRQVINSWVNQYSLSSFFQWAIVLKEDFTLIGSISLINVNLVDETAEIGYCIAKKYWNHGYMSEACRRVLEFSFQDIGFSFIFGRHISENIASGKVMLKNQMRFVGEKYDFVNKNKNIATLKFYKIQREDFI